MNKIRVLHVVPSMDPRTGGVAEGVRQLAVAMSAHGIVTDVVTLDCPGAEFLCELPFSVTALGPGRGVFSYSPRLVPWLRLYASNYKCVILNGLWQFTGIATHLVLRSLAVPYYVFPHGMLDPWFRKAYRAKHFKKLIYWMLFERRVIRDATGVLFTCDEERLLARGTFPLYRALERVTGYGIVAPAVGTETCVADFFRYLPDLVSRRFVLFLGRIHEKKGCDLLIDAFANVATRFPDVDLVMAGPGSETLISKLRVDAEQLGIARRLHWVGMMSGNLKWGALRAATVFALPSHQENFGVAVVEALACSTPVAISSRVNIWREIALDNAGWVAADDTAGTVQNLTRALSLNESALADARGRARRCFESRFEIGAVAASLAELIRSDCLARPSGPQSAATPS